MHATFLVRSSVLLLWLLMHGMAVSSFAIDSSALDQLLTNRPFERTAPGTVKRSSILSQYRERHWAAMAIFVPVQAAAADLEMMLNTISLIAEDRWAVGMPARWFAELGREHMTLLFMSSDTKVSVPWEFVMHVSHYLKDEVSKGWTGDYRASWTHRVTDVVITVWMRRHSDE